VRREFVDSLSRLVRHRQLGRVICVKLNDVGARVVGDHPPLQWPRDSPIPRTQHVIPVDAVDGSERDGYCHPQRRDWLRALPCDRPRRNVLRAGPVLKFDSEGQPLGAIFRWHEDFLARPAVTGWGLALGITLGV